MYWCDVHDDSAGGSWLGLDLVVEPQRGAPELRVEAGGGRLFRIMAGAWPILWARVADDLWGYWYVRARVASASPGLVVPPICAEEACATVEEPGTATWFAEWARYFASKLDQSIQTPLYSGRWWISPCDAKRSPLRPPRLAREIPSVLAWEGVVEQAAHGFTNWDFGDVPLPLALRAPAREEDGRLKAWRKIARQGKLPPLLLMWISGLQRYIVLDGHDRLHAAILEGTTPRALGLLGFREEPALLTDAAGLQAESIAAAVAANPNPRGGRPYSVDSVNRLLLEAYDDRMRLKLVTRAWPLTGGCSAWMQQVRSQLANAADPDLNMIA